MIIYFCEPLYIKDQNTNNLNIKAFDHWSGDTKQDAWFTAFSLHGVIESLERKPKSVTIISDNGEHYHNIELMIILSYWKEWYNICITHAIKRHVKLGYEIASGENIEIVIKDLSENNFNKRKQKMGTIAGIRKLNKFSPSKIQKIVKNRTITQPNPIISTHSNPPKLLTIPRINHQDTSNENLNDLVDELEHMVVNTTNEEITEKHENWKVFISSWALQQNQKIREPVKRIPTHIKYFFETMFHVGTANPRKKMTAAEMRSELIQRVQEGEIEEEDILKESTIANWITSFSRGWKHAMALQAIEMAEHTLKM
ncbi:hypothetical protein Glove_225g8 [Diversispora epigaea]|uniref:Uncharacterized protein n=1 Tax=Diversispora epigaea TaxID=1348612 RepID=A0A397IEP9_9GLOM|nr:hypothetical protein Glove_225g8 [Diversispora epigaea]